MNRTYHFWTVFLTAICLSAQSPAGQRNAESAIIRASAGNGVEPAVLLRDAFYDASRNMLPYYTVSRHTPENVVAVASLVIKKTKLVDAATSQLIIRELGEHLTGNFRLEQRNGISRGQNTNGHLLVPLRITPNNQVEELISYEINWRERSAPSPATHRTGSLFTQNSVLSTGTWYKIGVTKTGIHRINRAFLASLGITAANIDPSSIRVFGNGGAMLPELNSAPRVDDLVENPILVVDGGDNNFNNADYFLFYATGPTAWKRAPNTSRLKFQATKNLYSDTSFYFVSVDYSEGTPKRLQVQPSGSSPNVTTSSYDYYNFHEEDLFALAKSGRQHFGESFDISSQYVFTWPDGNFVVGDSIMAECILAANYSSPPVFELRGNGLTMTLTTNLISPSASHPDYARVAFNSAAALNTAAHQIALTIEKKTAKALGWLDKVTVNARRNLVAGARQLNFRDTRVSGPGKTVQYNISTNAPQGVQLWNVTNHLSPFIQAYNVSANGIGFVAPSGTSDNEYCLAPPGDFFVPSVVGKVPNQNLHALQQADYIIICHPLFINEAERLGAFHQKQEGYTYAVATTDQIYNEFSSGRPDITAIRDFIRMVYTRNFGGGRQVQYVCLMGDGSYNNKSRNLVNNSNLIPTYQSFNSVSPIQSVTSDDFYVMMDPNEGLGVTENSTDLVDIGIGRLTCRTVAEVRAVLNKIEHYYSRPQDFRVEETIPVTYENSTSTLGDWRTWVLFMADDGDAALHMEQSDTLARIVEQLAPGYNNDKIMLDAYQRFSTPGGNRYPDATDEFLRRLRKGVLLFNYTGHGGEVGLTAERMVDVELINSLDNFNQLSLFITATCEFSRYDDPNRTSAGELSLLNPNGAAIALMTTCRLAFSSTNLTLNKQIVKRIFSLLPDGRRPALGDIMRTTKASIGIQDYYYAHFHLLGDPALRLAYPEHQVHTSVINGRPVTSPAPDSITYTDTLKALSKVTIEGIVTDGHGNKLDFNGVVYPTVFDKEQRMSGLVNAPYSAVNFFEHPQTGPCDTCKTPFTFNLQKNILYRGKARVTNGDFKFTFLVPKDISFAHGAGKISYYATSGKEDAMGHYDRLIVGGENTDAIADDAGPQINLFLNEKNFVNGGTTDEKPILYADLIDSSGINTSGIGLGHDISVVLDKETHKPVVLNDYYEANLNSFQSGRVRYPFTKVEEGPHTLTFKVWDIQNNSSEMALDFIVARRAEVALKHVLNYPNPFTSRTKFFFEHNQSGVPLKVHIQVFTVSGKLVKTIQQTVVSNSFVSEGIDWDGRDDYGDKLARGVYIYKLAILDVNNKKAEKIEKLVILN